MKDKYLPIGSVVLLKDADKPIMITSYFIFSPSTAKKNKMYDYGACTYPEGVLNSDYAIGFNHDEIAEILHLGLSNDEFVKFNETLKSKEDEIHKKFDEEFANK